MNYTIEWRQGGRVNTVECTSPDTAMMLRSILIDAGFSTTIYDRLNGGTLS